MTAQAVVKGNNGSPGRTGLLPAGARRRRYHVGDPREADETPLVPPQRTAEISLECMGVVARRQSKIESRSSRARPCDQYARVNV